MSNIYPNHLSPHNLDTLVALGIKNLSIGVESLQDRHLRTLQRPYTTEEAKKAVGRAVCKNFVCVNADFIFALPNQTYNDVEQAAQTLVELDVDQIAAYPLFRFPYTKMGSAGKEVIINFKTLLKKRKMLGILENKFYDAGFERTSVWAFTKKGIPKYCSVTVPLQLGFGVSGSSYLQDIFYLNTFNVEEQIKSLENQKMAIALSIDLSEKMQMASWLYWRIYETRFLKHDFEKRFSRNFDSIYGKYMKLFAHLGFLHDDGEEIILSDRGSYWLHAFEYIFSIDYIVHSGVPRSKNPGPRK